MPGTIKIERPTYKFTIPEKARQFETDPHSLTFRPCTADEERQANEVAQATRAPLPFEMLRRSVCEIDGKPVDWSTPDPEWVERASPKVRDLAFQAFAKVNVPTKDEVDSFLASQEVGV